MAKSVQELEVALKLKGLEAVAELKSQLRTLGGVASVSSQDLGKVAAAVKNYTVKGGESIGVIKGQVTALKGLQQQAAINSSAFEKLGKDIAKYESKLRSAEQAAGAGQAAIRRRGAFVKAAPGRLLEREEFLRSKPSEGAFGEQGELRPEFVAQQRQLNILAEARIRLENRVEAQIRAVTKAQVDNNPKLRTAAEIVATYGGELNKLPRTTNNLQMELRELKSDFQNLTIGGKDYIETLRRINQLQGQLDDPYGTNARKQQIRGGLGQQQTFGMFQGRDPVQKSIERNLRKRAQQYGGFSGGGLANQPVQASGLFQQIASISGAGPAAQLEMMGRSYQQVANSIKTATNASNGSINSLNAQRASWASLRAGLDPASKGYREVGREIDKVDKRLARLNKRRGFSAKGAAQTVGAVASAGIFGGPLGAAGALGGAAIGGAAGAAVGGGIGASVGVLAQQVSGFTDYAASIRLSEKALKRLVTVENDRIQTAKNEAVATQVIEYAVAKLNVERADATIGMTRLSAAVLGAGGNIETAGLAFLGATKAIKATKGSAEDVRGGLTALVQMFSKGRISAEELSGQLGERFPAAVTAFAEANDISTQELQKMLKNGEVGLDKLVNFLQFAVEKYSDGALEMAASSEESGQRQTIAFQEVRRQLGEQLVSVGSELQQSITKALKDLTPTIVALAKASAEAIAAIINGIALLIKHFDKIKDLILVIVGGAVGGKILALVTTISFKIVPLIKKVGLLRAAILILNRTLLLNPLFLLASGITAAGIAISNFTNRHSNFIDKIDSGALSIKEAKDGLAKYRTELNKLETQKGIQDGTIQEIKPGNRGGIRPITPEDLRPSSGQPELLDSRIKTLKDTIKKGEASIKALEAGSNPLLGEGDFLANLLENSKIPGLDIDPSGGSGGSGTDNTQSRIDSANEIVRRLRDQLAIAQQQTEVGRFLAEQAKERSDQQAEFVKLQKDGEEDAITEAQIAAQQLLSDKQKEELNKRVNDLYEQASKALKDTLQTLKDKVTADKEYARLIAEGVNPELAKELININKIFESGDKKLQQRILDLEAQKAITGLSAEELQNLNDQIEAIERKREILGQDRIEAEGAAGDAYKQPTTAEGLKSNIADLKKELDELLDPVNQITGAANAIGTAFTDSFKSVIDGSATTQEALAGFFKNIANYFLDMAMQIIQKMITMYILNTVLKILPGFSDGAVFNPGAPNITGNSAGDFDLGGFFAKGGVFAKNKIVPYAKGGIVDKPTMFAYANGGAGRFGLMGEAGPEAIMPLSRGSDGKLGVQASGGGVGNVIVNVDASGSSVEGDAEQSKQLGKAIGIAVQQELIKQQRPGGLLG